MKALACTLGAILVAVTWSAPADALDITFDEVTSVGNPLVTTLETAGYRFTAASFRTIDTPGDTFVATGSAVYIAQEAGWPGGITVTRIDGAPFFLYEFDAAGLFVKPSSASPNAQQVTLLGLQAGGAFLSASYSLGSGLVGFAHFVVPATWQGLEAVTFTGIFAAGASGALALDDIGVGEGPIPTVPEPRTLLLVLTTAVAVGVLLLRRRPHTLARRRR
jgi:hypothetical protein